MSGSFFFLNDICLFLYNFLKKRKLCFFKAPDFTGTKNKELYSHSHADIIFSNNKTITAQTVLSGPGPDCFYQVL